MSLAFRKVFIWSGFRPPAPLTLTEQNKLPSGGKV
nr:MAG TPA_asm: hypothetical protein [Caudoviricetes sp.]